MEYLNSRDATIMGSRNGHAPIYMWCVICVVWVGVRGAAGCWAIASPGWLVFRECNGRVAMVRGPICRLQGRHVGHAWPGVVSPRARCQ